MRASPGPTARPHAPPSLGPEARLGARRGLEPGAAFRIGALSTQIASLTLPPRTEHLLRDGPPLPGDLETCAARRISGLLGSLTELLLDGRFPGTEGRKIAAALTGLGPGLTPSGDDVLAAIAACALRLAHAGAIDAGNARGFLDVLRASAGGRTNPVAAELVRGASLGLFPEALASFTEVLGDPSLGETELAARAARLARIGAHTGADMLAGVVSLARGSAARRGS